MNLRNERDSRIELLRIFAMLLIVAHHAMVHGLPMFLEFKGDAAVLLLQGLSFLGTIGNYIFIFISGWFLCGAKFRLRKIAGIWAELFFYSVTIALVFYFSRLPCRPADGITTGTLGRDFDPALFPCTGRQVLSAFMPFFRSVSWFVSCYILFYAASPFLNRMIFALPQKEHFALAVLTAVCALVIPMIPFDGLSSYASGNLVIFITVFFTASYLKRYPVKFLENSCRNLILAGILFLLLAGWRMLVVFVAADGIVRLPFFVSRRADFLKVFTSMRSFPMLILTVLIFFGFRNLKMKNSRAVNTVAGTTLGIYLIHDNGFVRYFLWFKICRLPERFGGAGFAPYLAAVILAVFAGCALIELLRQRLFAAAVRILARKK